MRRPEKVAELIREEVIQIVGYDLDDPRVASVTVTDVRVSDNLRDAKVYVTAEGTEEERTAALVALRKAAPYVRRQLGTSLNLRFTPEIHFVRDTVEESAARVEELLVKLEEERPRQPTPDEEAGAQGEEIANDER
ncbi:MAG TPA: 30S ribosome-binding factor RbfA [Pyrinomonadaceae bacterium]|jgi:ribosome-binding factor A|nr:30S ribosome-binding factor RbfA [Pyrinomonadaceae bacterium]